MYKLLTYRKNFNIDLHDINATNHATEDRKFYRLFRGDGMGIEKE